MVHMTMLDKQVLLKLFKALSGDIFFFLLTLTSGRTVFVSKVWFKKKLSVA